MFNPFGKLNIPEVSPEKVKEAIDNNRDVIILDVRTRDEFSKGHIARSISLTVNTLAQKVSSVIPDKKTVVYVYCFSGSRSIPAVRKLIDAGYTNVFNMPNGILAWRQKGYKLAND